MILGFGCEKLNLKYIQMDNKRINTNNTVNAKTSVNTALSSRLKNLTATEKKEAKS